jgi:hypothetical protein
MKRSMEERSSRRIRNLVTRIVHSDMTANEIECALIPMVARSRRKTLHIRGLIH